MAWIPLGHSLESKPQVLAGPILRKVTPKSVTVWIATRTGARVTLTVWDNQDQNVARMEGTRRTVAIGKNLHIVAVTATPLDGKPLTEGIVYVYDVGFVFDGNVPRNLKLATHYATLAYAPFALPSFALPPKDLNSLRVLQGSCRMPHGEGTDAMPMIDDLIAPTARNAYARPHQLLLTGDQIYADDVADALLLMLSDAGNVLLGWTEILPFLDSPVAATALPVPCRRASVLMKAGLTSEKMQSHVMSLGEYLCMYLFAWSNVLWPAALPSVDQIRKLASLVAPSSEEEIFKLIDTSTERLDAHGRSLAEFATTLPKVRCALANIPTYMIFDDHEVTDDWNTTRNWCRDVYGNPLALRMVQNALVAYALCQHWGNAPEQFDDPSKPGGSLLTELETPQPTQPNAFSRKATEYNENSRSIRTLLGVHDDAVLQGQPENAVFHDDFSLQYHYTVEGTGHQVIVTDTRTWRSFPRGGRRPPDFLRSSTDVTKDQFTQQILKTPDLAGRVLLVVLTTNAPAVQPIRATGRHPGLVRGFRFHPDVHEAWEMPLPGGLFPQPPAMLGFDRLLRTLTSKLPKDANGQHYGQVILLSGDVHHSFATRLFYHATTRFEDQQPQPARAVIAQLVASAFKKEDELTRGLQENGYTYGPWVAHQLEFIPRHEPEGYAGWNVPVGSNRVVGKEKSVEIVRGEGGAQSVLINHTRKIKLNQPTVALWKESPMAFATYEFSSRPDYRYLLDYLEVSRSGMEPPVPPMIRPVTAGTTPKQAAEAFRAAHAHYRLASGGLTGNVKIIGVNNFAEITFDWPAGGNKKVNHTLRWRNPRAPMDMTWSTYEVSLNPPNDDRFLNLDIRP